MMKIRPLTICLSTFVVIINNFSQAQQKIKQFDIYNEVLRNYVTVNKPQSDTLFIQQNDSIDFRILPQIGNTVIQVLPWSQLAEKIQNRQLSFYTRLVPLRISPRETVIGIFGSQVEMEDKELMVFTQRRYEQVSFSTNRKRSKYKFIRIKTEFEHCSLQQRIDNATRILIVVMKTCV